MRSSFAVRSGLQLIKSPNYREQAARRRWAVLCAMLALALASGLIGTLSAPRHESARSSPVQTGPFSYFPSE